MEEQCKRCKQEASDATLELSRQSKAFKEQEKTLNQELNKFRLNMNDYKHRVEAAERALERYKTIEADLKKIRKEFDTAQIEISSLKNKLWNANERGRVVEDLQRRFGDVNKDNRKLMSDLSQKNSTIMTLEERLDNESRLHQSALAKIEAEMDQVRHKMQGEIDDVEALYNRALGDNAILKEQLGYCKGDNERLKKRTQNIIREQEQIILEQGNKISSLTAVSSNAHDAMREMQQRMVELQIRLGAARKESKIIKEQSQSKDSEMGNLKKSLMEKTRVNHSLLSQLDGIQNDFREFLSQLNSSHHLLRLFWTTRVQD